MRWWAGVPFILIAALPFLFMLGLGSGERALPSDADEILVVISPHSIEMQDEYARGFAGWMRDKYRRNVRIQWTDTGGTSKMVKELESRFSTNPDRPGADVMFGGGVDPYINARAEGWLEPVTVPTDTLNAIPPRCAGFPTRDPEGYWYGVALSGFGILYNQALLDRMNLPTPTTWEDLARPELYSWVGSGDPSSSGSVHMCYEIILQAAGFEPGWHLIVRIAGNVRRFGEGGGTVPREVASGDIACGMVIDMYAERTISSVGSDALQFVLPSRMTLIGPDSVAVLKNAPSPDLARLFVEYALSEEGQRILIRPEGVKEQRHALYRKPVRASLYSGEYAPRVNPYAVGSGFDYDSVKGGERWRFVSDLIKTCCIDSHSSLRRAWKAVIDAGAPEDLVDELCAAPCTESEAEVLVQRWNDPAFRQDTIKAWAGAARDRYERVREKALALRKD